MDSLSVIESVHSFYSDAFTQLLTLTIAIFAIIGVLMPLILQHFQNKSFRIEQKSLESMIKNGIQNTKFELEQQIQSIIQTEIKKTKEIISDETAVVKQLLTQNVDVVTGGIFFVQGSHYLESKDFALASYSYASAAICSFRGEDDLNGQRALKRLVERCFPELNSLSFDTVSYLEKKINDLLEALRAKNSKHRFTDDIETITRALAKAKNNVPNSK